MSGLIPTAPMSVLRPLSARPRVAVLAPLLFALTACGDSGEETPSTGPDAPRWLHLVEQYEPDTDELPRELARSDGWTARLEAIDGGVWLTVDFEPEVWTETSLPGVIAAPSPLPPSMVDLDQQVFLTCDGVDLERRSFTDTSAYADDVTGVFGMLGDQVLVRRGDASGAPRAATLRARAPLGRPDGSRWHVDSGRFSGDGFFVLPGDARSFTIPAGTDRRLSFGHFVSAGIEADDRIEFTIEQDGEVLWQHRVGADDVGTAGHFAAGHVDLNDADTSTELNFVVDGPFCYSGFTSPVVGPDLGDAPASHVLDGRPNIVLFVADTFRADNLVDYRMLADAPEDTIVYPALERLVDQSLRFQNNWAASTWTLPSHASMFSSLLPLQHRAVEALMVLPQQAHVIAEVMRGAGYRTVAVTDGVLVTSTAGLAQGFEEFDQISVDAPQPLDRARALLERGDGRPSFVLVHTYFPHTPFQPTADARAAIGYEGEEVTSRNLVEPAQRQLQELAARGEGGTSDACRTLERLYRAQVLDFDREFDAWMERFDAHGWRDSTHLFFTSDHGEAFGDHGHFGHGGLLWESQARVPLLWLGPGVEPGVRTDPSSGIDLAPTMAALGGARPSDRWQGRDLGAVREGGHVWASKYWLQRGEDERPERRRSIVTDGRFKIHSMENGGTPYAFDLDVDPDELARFGPDDARWPVELGRIYERELTAIETAHLPDTHLTHPSDDTLGALRAMGYLED